MDTPPKINVFCFLEHFEKKFFFHEISKYPDFSTITTERHVTSFIHEKKNQITFCEFYDQGPFRDPSRRCIQILEKKN